jgi:hypothetical protein
MVNSMNLTSDTAPRDFTEKVAVTGENKEATPIETEIFLQLLANITKRILTEASEQEVESKAS